ncbi:Fc receptor-like protein 6 [Rhynchocyon petersi]
MKNQAHQAVTPLILPSRSSHPNMFLQLHVQPDPVFEGDVLTLQCQSRSNAKVSQVKFFRDREFLHFSEDNQPLSAERAAVKNSGKYRCSGVVTYSLTLGRYASDNVTVHIQELFPPPVLSVVPFPVCREGSPMTLRCQTKLHPQRSASRLFFSFYKDGQSLQSWSLYPEFQIPRAQEEDSGLYQCEAATEGGRVQKQSSHLEIRVQVPVSPPLINFQSGASGPAEGKVVELLCEAERGSPPILYLFYLNGKIVGNYSALQGGAASLLLVKSGQESGNYSCEAVNGVSRAHSERKLSLNGPRVLSTPMKRSTSLISWLPPSLLGVTVIAATLLGYFKPWRKARALPSQSQPPAPDGRQCLLFAKVHHQSDENEDVTYSVVHTIPKRSKASPVELTSRKEDTFPNLDPQALWHWLAMLPLCLTFPGVSYVYIVATFF